MEEGEPRNAASEMTRLLMPRLSEPEFLEAWPDRATEDFTMEDRRRLVGLPTVDVYEFMQRLRDGLTVNAGTPLYSVEAVLAVRGKRLALLGQRTWFPDREFQTDSLILIAYDRPVWRTERVIQFDENDVDAALVELDRLHAEHEAEEPQAQ